MSDVLICPRCGSGVSPIGQDVEVALPGGATGRETLVTGWMCDGDHFLAESEPVRA